MLGSLSCETKEESIRNIDNEIQLIELHLKIDSLENKILQLRTVRQMDPIDSLQLKLDDYRKDLESLKIIYSMDVEDAIENCKNYFGLEILDDKEINYLHTYYAYKVFKLNNGCGYLSFESKEEAEKYIAKKNKLQEIYDNYVDSIVQESRMQTFPNINDKEMDVFNFISEIRIIYDDSLYDNFNDSVRRFIRKDTQLIKLYDDIVQLKISEMNK